MTFKSMVSQTQIMLKTIWDNLSESINQIFDWIEKVDAEKNEYMMKMEKIKNWWEYEIKSFKEKSNEGIKQIQQFIKELAHEPKKDLPEILAQVKNIEISIFSRIIEMCKKEKISNSLRFLSEYNTLKLFEQQSNKVKYSNDSINQIEVISEILKTIYEHEFNNKDYFQRILFYKLQISQKKYLMSRISQISQYFQLTQQLKITNFFKVDLIHQTFDLSNKCFENIKIQNTSLIGGNFVKCNLSRSEFNNLDISGINLNGALLFNCKWKNLKINTRIE
ncbi:unnamed protein product [Paramecium sonneborni]|uniref:Pentapeptide repeat-containing protein n=1 Tax=Paramecium sonneborni TaxID=65129 RepID=A0A8S1RQR5_9CILI|nr:unnamed protein product [Paramecium sonneborni]